MGALIRKFLKDEEGLGTVELVIIIAVLVGIALIFRKAIFGFVQDMVEKVFGGEINDLRLNPTSPPS